METDSGDKSDNISMGRLKNVLTKFSNTTHTDTCLFDMTKNCHLFPI